MATRMDDTAICRVGTIAPRNEVLDMATRKMVCIMVTACVLSACGGPVVTLKNPQSGELASCKGGAAATGVASEGVADGLMTECVDGYTRQGYEVVAATR